MDGNFTCAFLASPRILLPCKSCLQGLNQLQPRLLQPQQPLMQAPQALYQYQLQRQAMHQNQLKRQAMLQAQARYELELQRIKMLSEQNTGSLNDDIPSTGDTVSSNHSLFQVGHPVLFHGDIDVLLKVPYFYS